MEFPVKYIVLGLAVLMYVLVIAFPAKKTWFPLGGALVLVLLGIISPFHALFELVNWNILMIYIGSLVIAELFIYSRLPARIADNIVAKTPNAGLAMVAILIMTGIISAFVENVATVLVMAPIALSLTRKLKINPTYFLVGLAVMANLEGTATLVGDPPSMIFASYAGYGFNEFFFHEGRISIFFFVQAGLIAGALFFYYFFSKSGKEKILTEKTQVISYFPMILLLLMIIGLAASSTISALGNNTNGEVPLWTEYVSGSIVMFLAVAGIFWFCFKEKKGSKETFKMIKNLDWETILFLSGIFIVIGALSETGILQEFADFLTVVISGNVFAGFVIIIVVSMVLSGFIDNVPYIIVMLPVAATLAKNMNLTPELYLFALLIGSCLGGNLTPFGASANIVAMGILKRENYPMNFSGWLKIGLPFTLITTGTASLLLWLLYS